MLRLPAVLTHQEAMACLKVWLTQLPMGGASVVVLDASDMQTFDTSAVALILELRRHLQMSKQSLELVGVSSRLQDLLGLYGVADLLAVSAAETA
jgi:phospholipid transport system transporter-binding protein